METPKGLNECALTDVSLLREWLANVCDPKRQESKLFDENKEILEEAGYDRSVVRAIAAHKTFSRESVIPNSLNVRVLNPQQDDQDVPYEEAA